MDQARALSWNSNNWSTGAPRSFPQTSSSMVARLRSAGSDRDAGLEILCISYWRPVYSYVLLEFRTSREEAQDLTQSFFLWLIEGKMLANYLPEQTSFHKYLKGLLRNFHRNHRRALRRLKRGGGSSFVSRDELRSIDQLPDVRAESPEQAFDRSLRENLIAVATSRIRERYLAKGHSLRFATFEEYELNSCESRPTYASVAESLCIKVSDVRNYLYAVREDLRNEIRHELSKSVSSYEQLQEAWRDLGFG